MCGANRALVTAACTVQIQQDAKKAAEAKRAQIEADAKAAAREAERIKRAADHKRGVPLSHTSTSCAGLTSHRSHGGVQALCCSHA